MALCSASTLALCKAPILACMLACLQYDIVAGDLTFDLWHTEEVLIAFICQVNCYPTRYVYRYTTKPHNVSKQ